jgi:hypothetical protein
LRFNAYRLHLELAHQSSFGFVPGFRCAFQFRNPRFDIFYFQRFQPVIEDALRRAHPNGSRRIRIDDGLEERRRRGYGALL